MEGEQTAGRSSMLSARCTQPPDKPWVTPSSQQPVMSVLLSTGPQLVHEETEVQAA